MSRRPVTHAAAVPAELSEQEHAFLDEVLSAAFVDNLPLLKAYYQLHRSDSKAVHDGAEPRATKKEILASLKHVATVAARGDEAATRKAVRGAVPPIEGWYLPWHLSRLFGPPGLEGMDPALLDTANPAQIAGAARAAMADPLLMVRGRPGHPEGIAERRLVLAVRQAYEFQTGKHATADGRGSRFLDALGIVARVVGWHATAETQRERAMKLLDANLYEPLRGAFSFIGRLEKKSD